MDRFIKQITIAAIFFVLIAGLAYGGYRLVRVEPTCFDQIKNQGEEGVDCGLVCSNACEPTVVPLEIQEVQLISFDGHYDLVAKVRNPNTLVGAANASYDLILKDTAGQQVGVVKDTFYILPVQTKYIVKSPLPISGITPASAELVVKDVTWHHVNAADLKIDFPLIREQHGPISAPGVKYQVEAVMANTSDFDFDQADMAVLLLDNSGGVRAVATTTINTFLAKSQRYFKVTWPSPLPANLTVQVQGSTNVFNNSNFIRRYGTQEEFQRYQ